MVYNEKRYLCGWNNIRNYENSINRIRKDGQGDWKGCSCRGHEIVSIIDVDNQDDFNSEAFKSADVAIEFTNPMDDSQE